MRHILLSTFIVSIAPLTIGCRKGPEMVGGVEVAKSSVLSGGQVQAVSEEAPGLQPLLKIPDTSKHWVLDEQFSDEFESETVDTNKWTKSLKPWGERSWSPDNVFQKDGSLVIHATYEPHRQRGKEYFYKLGIFQSLKKTTYGYFEARIKGCSRFPGLCPPSWLYSNAKELDPAFPKVTHSEIDIVEKIQGE